MPISCHNTEMSPHRPGSHSADVHTNYRYVLQFYQNKKFSWTCELLNEHSCFDSAPKTFFFLSIYPSAAEKISRGSPSWPSILWETESSMPSSLRGEPPPQCVSAVMQISYLAALSHNHRKPESFFLCGHLKAERISPFCQSCVWRWSFDVFVVQTWRKIVDTFNWLWLLLCLPWEIFYWV